MFRSIIIMALVATMLGGEKKVIAQKLSTGPQVLTVFSNVDDSEQPYGLYLPKDFNPAKKYPLVIMLHGAWSNHRLGLRRVFGKSNQNCETDVEATRYFPKWKDIDYIVASPLARGTMGYQGIAEKDVYDVLADVERRFPIDRNRIYLTGLSMGGGGTLWIGLTRPGIWAAIAPVCPAPPAEARRFAANALDYPVSIHQGQADPVVNPDSTRAWVKRLKALGTHVEYTEYPGVGHNSWEEAYKDEAIFKWFSKYRRNPFPDRVRFVTDRYKYNSAYWLTIDELTPGVFGSVDAGFTGENKIEIAASHIGAFTLDLKGHPRFRPGRKISVTIDGQALSGITRDMLGFVLRDGKWAIGRYEPAPGSKRPGVEGPIGEAFADRHVYVYGTLGNPSPAELGARREEAETAAKWISGVPLLYFPRVIADRDVRPSDYASGNLILFGTERTNSVIKDLSYKLPVEFKGADSGYGIVYIYPDGEHYVLVCSGEQWWPKPGEAQPLSARRGFRFIGGPVSMLIGYGDYVLYKGSLDSMVVEGRFDNSWQMPESDAAKMDSTGAVLVIKSTK